MDKSKFPTSSRVPQPAGRQVEDWYRENRSDLAMIDVLHALAHMTASRDKLLLELKDAEVALGHLDEQTNIKIDPPLLDNIRAAIARGES